MSEPHSSSSIRRILVALDASPQSLAALEAATELAARMEAELAGLFVEDVELLRIAESGAAREIAYPSATEAPLNRSLMERKWKAQSEQIQNALAAAAHRAKIRWSFRTVRGHVTAAVRAAASPDDIVAVGRIGWSLGGPLRIGSTARDLAASSIPLLLISRHAARGSQRLLVYYDGSSASTNALLIATKLAKAGAKGITVLVPTTASDEALAEIPSLFHGQDQKVRLRSIDLDDRESLARAVNEEQAEMLILAGRKLLKDPETLESLLAQLEVPLILLGNGTRAAA